MSEFQAFTLSLADPDRSCAYRALHDLVRSRLGAKVFTLQTNDPRSGAALRLYSSSPDVFPVGGLKPADETHWSQIVLVEHRSFVANSVAELSAVFPDVELIVTLGCESILNVPVVIDGEVRGTLNCLAEAGHWTSDRIAAAEDLKLLGAVCFLRHELDQKMESER